MHVGKIRRMVVSERRVGIVLSCALFGGLWRRSLGFLAGGGLHLKVPLLAKAREEAFWVCITPWIAFEVPSGGWLRQCQEDMRHTTIVEDQRLAGELMGCGSYLITSGGGAWSKSCRLATVVGL